MALALAKKVVVCADDFGLTEAACTSIVALSRAGAISATSCVVDGAFAERFARDLPRSALSIGLHFNLTATAERSDSVLGWILRAYVLRSISPANVSAEIDRQLDRFEALFGRPPHFIDGHHHVH